jgi:transposase-like protein
LESDLAEWRRRAIEGLSIAVEKRNTRAAKDDRRIKQLERRLGAAEALLDLQKKIQDLWGDAAAPTDETKER